MLLKLGESLAGKYQLKLFFLLLRTPSRLQVLKSETLGWWIYTTMTTIRREWRARNSEKSIPRK